jgi:hypothetical protein
MKCPKCLKDVSLPPHSFVDLKSRCWHIGCVTSVISEYRPDIINLMTAVAKEEVDYHCDLCTGSTTDQDLCKECDEGSNYRLGYPYCMEEKHVHFCFTCSYSNNSFREYPCACCQNGHGESLGCFYKKKE